MQTNLRKLVMASLFAALVCVATMIVKIPSPLKGYLNLGDCVVLAAGWLFSPVYGFLAAGLGSALADIFSGYITYAPATFLIKGAMALIACYGFRLCNKKLKGLVSHLLSAVASEVFMVLGYLVFEGVLYGFVPSLVNVPANGMQGVAGVVLGVAIIRILERLKLASR